MLAPSILYGLVTFHKIKPCPNVTKLHTYIHWRQTKVETTGATLRLRDFDFETFLDFETKNQVVPRHAGTA